MNAETTTYNFFDSPEITARRISQSEAQIIGEQHFGHPVIAHSLGSQQDQNFLVTDVAGHPMGVLKVANPMFSEIELTAQDHATEHVRTAEPELRVAFALTGIDGEVHKTVHHADGTTLIARILQYLPGPTVGADNYLNTDVAEQMGDISGRVSRSLRTFDHPGLDRVLVWDPQHTPTVTARLLPHIADEGRRLQIERAIAQAWEIVERLSNELPRQAVHLDITNTNMVGVPEHPQRYDGILDFGDLCRTWAVAELASTATSVLHHPDADPLSVLSVVRSFHQARPLSAVEVQAFWPLVVLRAAILVLAGTQQVTIEPDNEYAREGLRGEWRMFEAAVSVPIEVMTSLVHDTLGLPQPFKTSLPEMITPLFDAEVAVLDLSTTATLWDRGAWLRSDGIQDAVREAHRSGIGVVASIYGQARITTGPALDPSEPATMPTGCDAWFAEATALRAPCDCIVERRTCNQFALKTPDLVIVVTLDDAVALDSLCTGEVSEGSLLTVVAAHGSLHVQVRRTEGPVVPDFVAPRYWLGWLAMTADPAVLLGMPIRSLAASNSDLLAQREQHLAEVQEHYYVNPPHLERGWKHFLLSTDGRAYLDMVNNVAVLGHSHPQLSERVSRQFELLNTNSRFNYSAIVEFSAKVTDRLPPSLDQVFLVNSGTEANDLALRLAMAATGRHHLVAMGEAYHGWTFLTDAVSTSTADNPNALGTRPDWIHTLESANSYRGLHRGAQAHEYARDAVAKLRRLATDGVEPAAFIAESVYGNAGGMYLPDGYLDEVYSTVREMGGLTIADEVQVGYGRLGDWFWGFEQQRVVPDIVTMAKAMGNGYPLGIVATSRAVADAYRAQGYFFSSAGGSPASCVVGSAVLDILDQEDLQGNAQRVGTHLKQRLLELADKHSIIGTVHGHGLYLGVELVRDRATLEPAPSETQAICERMLDKGIIIQPTGDRMCILKVKPPLCVDISAADYFVDTLDSVLTTGW
ncbi:aminotransferase [Rhodococcus globerulus]|uniref:Aminotransferase n=1 Tax=Rhodococcus globerulus TaxID=33008 RepID=A0ABU4C2T8_RHOGO|nr:aminotransferase [Rhodococcus globerulus]MDV6270801.1 aminotransferase [Rhodococcus globerulus]